MSYFPPVEALERQVSAIKSGYSVQSFQQPSYLSVAESLGLSLQ